jgi:hypothetical protein
VIQFLIVLVILGAALYIISLLPIDATIKQIIQVIAVVAVVVYALKTLLPLAGLD